MDAVGAAAVRNQRVELIEVEDHRGVLPRLVKERADHLLRAVDVNAREIRGFHELIVPAGLLRELLRDEGLAASRRSVEQHAIRDLDPELLCALRVFEHIDDFLTHQLLDVLHSGDIGKAVPLLRTETVAPFIHCGLCPDLRHLRHFGFPEKRVKELTGTGETFVRIRCEGHGHRIEHMLIDINELDVWYWQRSFSLFRDRTDLLIKCFPCKIGLPGH